MCRRDARRDYYYYYWVCIRWCLPMHWLRLRVLKEFCLWHDVERNAHDLCVGLTQKLTVKSSRHVCGVSRYWINSTSTVTMRYKYVWLRLCQNVIVLHGFSLTLRWIVRFDPWMKVSWQRSLGLRQSSAECELWLPIAGDMSQCVFRTGPADGLFVRFVCGSI